MNPLEELECEFCTIICFSKNELEEHMKISHSNTKYTCNVCKKGFATKSSVSRHKRIHENVFPYQCKLCPKASRTRNNLANHMKIHSSEKPFKCDKCPATFRQKGNIMQQHQLRHQTNEKPYECPVKCGRRFATLDRQRRHAKIHSSESQKYVCAYCEKEFLWKYELRRHIFSRHASESRSESQFAKGTTASETVVQSAAIRMKKMQKYECAYCKKECSQKSNLRSHIFVRHAGQSPPEAQFSSNTTAAKTEVRNATGEFSTLFPIVPGPEIIVEKPREGLNCEFCTEVCFSKNELKEHTKKCHSYKECKCPVCGKLVSNKRSLKSHNMRMHEGKFSHTCKVCHKAFKTLREWVRHNKRIHLDEKPFKCDECPATFTRSRTLQLHKLKHRRNEKTKPVKIEKEEIIECFFTPYAMKFEQETPRYALCEPAEVKNWRETIKCTLVPVEIEKEQITETIKRTLESDEIKNEETKQCAKIKLEEAPKYELEPVEVRKWETIKCTLEPVEVKEEQETEQASVK